MQYVYDFGKGDTKDKYLLGGKGCGLGEMHKIGLPVPPGFTISTQACVYHINTKGKEHAPGLDEEIQAAVRRLEEQTQRGFGRAGSQGMLLLSVRSGAAFSMPGMMDTVLNLGLNDKSVLELAKLTGNERFAWDSYRRFVQMFGDVVMGVASNLFEHELHSLKQAKQYRFDTEMQVEDLRTLVQSFKRVIRNATRGDDNKAFPEDPFAQLMQSIDAVFRSWDTDRAVFYRTTNGISHTLGTAVNVQMMVFGNMGEDSGTGVAFTRSPVLGTNQFYGEYLCNAQGEDVVAGTRTPEAIETMQKRWPKVYDQLAQCFHTLEQHFKEMQDVEFTIERGKLYMLQTRKGKRTAKAAVKIAVDMVAERLITKHEALLAIDANQLDQLLHKQLDPSAKQQAKLLAKGMPASPGAAVGVCVFSAEEAVHVKRDSGLPVVLIRTETSPEDIHGMQIAQGVLTQRGGMTSHAAVVARGMGRCCITGCEQVQIASNSMRIGPMEIKSGEWITLDGTTGEVFFGKLQVVDPLLDRDYETVMQWADEVRTLKVRTNADTPQDAKRALQNGAEGIGLVRTEHMFFNDERINLMRTMILAATHEDRTRSLTALLPFQQQDFEGIFRVMTGKPVIIRLLDPPFHEFLPHEDAEIAAVAKLIPGATVQTVKRQIQDLKEINPMLGFRGCRLSVVFPEITEMQLRAIYQAAVKVKSEGVNPIPEVEVPLVGNLKEYLPIKQLAKHIFKDCGAERAGIAFRIGSMVEVPRAALTSDELASECDFLSFGTNDLTQMTCGFSRDDAGKFLVDYVRRGIYDRDPFVSIDTGGVGKMMQICVALARDVKPDLDIGICGEHGGEPSSVEFCHRIGLSNVSCSPFRVPIARLAAAQARIKYGPAPQKLDLLTIFGKGKL